MFLPVYIFHSWEIRKISCSHFLKVSSHNFVKMRQMDTPILLPISAGCASRDMVKMLKAVKTDKNIPALITGHLAALP